MFRDVDEPGHRYLCLLGCWFRADEYRAFHEQLERFKQEHILRDRGRIDTPEPPFASRLTSVLGGKFNRHLYDGRVEGYGKVLFP